MGAMKDADKFGGFTVMPDGADPMDIKNPILIWEG
jgi:hypothetical protein